MNEITKADVIEAQANMTDAQMSARNRRNAFIGWSLLVYVVLVFIVTLARLSDGGLQLDKLAQ